MTDTIDDLPNLQSAEETVSFFDESQSFAINGQLWCPACKLRNRFIVTPMYLTANQKYDAPRGRAITGLGVSGPTWRSLAGNVEVVGSQFQYSCTRCRGSATALFRVQGGKVVVSVFFSGEGSLATKSTPTSVAYYLEQAYLCQSVKAYSATLGMYRTALDAILFNAGYKDGMVGKKIADLERDLERGAGPVWAKNLNARYLKVIKDLGNSSLHVSDEDLNEERAIDDDLIQQVEITFHVLLDEAYEKAARETARLEKLEAISKKKAGKTHKTTKV